MSYVRVVGNVLEARAHGGNILVEVAVVESRIKKIFTGKMELGKLKNQPVYIYIPKIKTQQELSDKEKKRLIEKAVKKAA